MRWRGEWWRRHFQVGETAPQHAIKYSRVSSQEPKSADWKHFRGDCVRLIHPSERNYCGCLLVEPNPYTVSRYISFLGGILSSFPKILVEYAPGKVSMSTLHNLLQNSDFADRLHSSSEYASVV